VTLDPSGAAVHTAPSAKKATVWSLGGRPGSHAGSGSPDASRTDEVGDGLEVAVGAGDGLGGGVVGVDPPSVHAARTNARTIGSRFTRRKPTPGGTCERAAVQAARSLRAGRGEGGSAKPHLGHGASFTGAAHPVNPHRGQEIHTQSFTVTISCW
jgi:hypothetical protein